jgi:Protein of unknown function (DUF3122)
MTNYTYYWTFKTSSQIVDRQGKVNIMLYRFFNTIWWLLLLWMLILFLFFNFAIFNSQTAIAAVSKLEATPGEILYRQEEKLVDADSNSWHVILMKRVYPSQESTIYLRLIGCPGSGELLHPQPMKIISSTGAIWKARDIFLDEAPAPTIGQYDFKDILPELPTDNLQLVIPLGRKHFVNILVPQSVVEEWQKVAVLAD